MYITNDQKWTNMTNIKKLFIAFITVITAISANSACAGYTEEQGVTTCYILKNNKLVKNASCSYYNGLYVAVVRMDSDYSFTIEGYKDISTSEIAYAKKDKNDEVIVDKNNSIVFNPTVLKINDKPATSHYRYTSSLKVVPKQKIKKYKVSTSKNILSCIQATDKSLEICTPYADVNFGY